MTGKEKRSLLGSLLAFVTFGLALGVFSSDPNLQPIWCYGGGPLVILMALTTLFVQKYAWR